MSEQDPTYLPPVGDPPADTPGAVGPPVPGVPETLASTSDPEPEGGASRRRTWIIVVVVAALLVCCCAGGALTYALLMPEETVTTPVSALPEPEIDDITGELPDEEEPVDARLQEWLDWNPQSPGLLPGPPADKQNLVLEGLGLVAPDFTLEESVWEDGWYDTADDWYYADGAYVRALHPSSDQVSAAVEMWIQSDDMIAEGVSLETGEGDALATVGGGSFELLYWNQWGDGFDLAGNREVSLWKQIGVDWPDAVVVNGYPGEDPDTFEIEFTKWGLFAVAADYPVVYATYGDIDGVWTLLEWEYVASDGSTTISI